MADLSTKQGFFEECDAIRAEAFKKLREQVKGHKTVHYMDLKLDERMDALMRAVPTEPTLRPDGFWPLYEKQARERWTLVQIVVVVGMVERPASGA